MLRYSIEKTVEMVLTDIRRINPSYGLFYLPRNPQYVEFWVRDKAKRYKTVKIKRYIIK